MLHIINKSNLEQIANNNIPYILPSHHVILIEDGVYCSISQSPILIKLLATKATIFAVENDIQARGLGTQISSEVQLASYKQFVELAASTSTSISW